MRRTYLATATVFTVLLAFAAPSEVSSHGDVTPQPVDTEGLEELGDEWRSENPFRGNAKAIEVGASAYNQNCARCHGIEAISGGIAPDLRELEETPDGDAWYISRVRKGATVNGVYKMPPFEGLMNQEAMWAIRAYIDARPME